MCALFSVVSDSVIPWTVAHHQAPLSMEISRQEYESELPFPSPGDRPDPVIKSMSSVALALVSGFFATEPPGKPKDNTMTQYLQYFSASQ